MDETENTDDQPLVTLSQIAELAHVGPSAVSNWRRRYDDFPPPIRSAPGGRDLYSLDAVEDWLERYERLDRAAYAERLLFRAADIVRSDARSDELIGAMCAALALAYHHRAPGQPIPSMECARLVVLAEASKPELAGVFQPLLELSARAGDRLVGLVIELERSQIRGAFEWLLTRRDRFVETRTVEILTKFLTELDQGASVFDPAAGEGGFLLRARQRGATEVCGQEINEATLRIARQRFIVHDAIATLRVGDSLRNDQFPNVRADVVYCDPPYGLRVDAATFDVGDARWAFGPPTTQTTDYAWLQHVIHHLKADGRGYVLLPAGSLYRGGREAELRREIVRRGAVEGVIGLPQGTADRTGMPLALWLVRPPLQEPERSRVLFVDATANGSGPRALDPNRIAEVVQLIQRWRASPHLEEGDLRIAASASLLDVLDSETNLLPSRWVHPAPTRTAAQIRREIDDLTEALDERRRSLAELASMANEVGASWPSSSSWVSVRKVTSDGLGEVIRGTKVREEDCTTEGVRVLRTRDVAEGHSGVAEPCYLAADAIGPNLRLTQPGDIIVSPGGGAPKAIVDQTGGNLLASPLQALRIHGDWIEPELAAAFLQSPRNRRFVAGTTYGYARLDLRDLEMPLLPKGEAARLLGAISHAQEAERIANDAAEKAHALRDALVEAAYLTATQANRANEGQG